jgi:heme exporter protein B
MGTGFPSIMKTAIAVANMEWRLEWRQGHQLASVGLFAVASVYVAFQAADRETAAGAWTAMLWLVYLFSGFTAVGRLFDRERSATRQYLQWAIHPMGLILGKLTHAILTTTALTALVLAAFVLFLGWPSGLETASKPGLLILSAWLGGFSMTTTLVFVTAMASQIQSGNGALGAVLGLPLLLPQLILVTRLTRGALDGTPWGMLGELPLFLAALSAGTSVIACILFPYIWRA